MRTEMTREEARDSIERWRLVRKRQREEDRRLSLDEKFRRLLLLVQARRGFPDPHRAADEEAVRDRWRRLREIQLA